MDFMANFQNISGEQHIAKICKVSTRTARRWISGKSKPRRVYLDLLLLHDRGRVMPLKWNTYCQFKGEHLDFGHKHAITHSELDWYMYSITLWRTTMDLLPEIEARIDALMKVCPTAEVINLQAYKDEIKRFKERSFYMPNNHKEPIAPIELQPKLISRSHGC